MEFLNYAFGLLGIVLVGILIKRKMDKERRLQRDRTAGLFADVLPLFSTPNAGPGESTGSWVVSGDYGGAPFQLRSIIDTLATRKLPSLWLQVTLQRQQPVSGTLDIMLRPAGLSSFSNFDFLRDTLPNPAGAPVEAVTKCDDAVAAKGLCATAARHMGLLHLPRAKELLITPKGLRLVLQIGEASRVRYGVFRQADFDGTVVRPEMLLAAMNGLLALAQDLRDDASHG